jgi:hypothetical protein
VLCSCLAALTKRGSSAKLFIRLGLIPRYRVSFSRTTKKQELGQKQQGLNLDPSENAPAPSWIQFPTDGGAYSSESAVQALTSIISKKISHYGRSESSDLRLVIYYD